MGPFENFIQASTLGMRFEWFSNNRWLIIGIHRGKEYIPPFSKTVGDFEPVISNWRTAMRIIQALDGTLHADTENGFDRQVNFGAIKVMQLQVDRLQQLSIGSLGQLEVVQHQNWQIGSTISQQWPKSFHHTSPSSALSKR